MESKADIEHAIKTTEGFLKAAQKAGDKEAVKDIQSDLTELKGKLKNMAKVNEMKDLVKQADNKDLKNFRKNIKEALKKKVVARLNEKEEEIAKALFRNIKKTK